MTRTFIVIVVAYIVLATTLLFLSVICPCAYPNFFAVFTGIMTGGAAIWLGHIAINQAQEHKINADDRDATPILVMNPNIPNSITHGNLDFRFNNPSFGRQSRNFSICSLNKSVFDFMLTKVVLSNNKNITETFDTPEHPTVELSSDFCGTFLPATIYYMSMPFPPVYEHSTLQIEFEMKNIYYQHYKKIIVFEAKNDKWEAVGGPMSRCKPINLKG